MGCKAFTSSKSCCRVTLKPRRHLHSSLCNRVKAPIRRHASSSQGPEVLDVSYDFVAQNQGLFRSLPLWSGGLSIVALLLNRAISGIAPVVDASSSQSRADVLAIIMSAVLLLTGLQWLSLKPKVVPSVTLEGEEVNWVDREVRLPAAAVEELQWTWSALRACTRCKSLVVLLECGQQQASAVMPVLCHDASMMHQEQQQRQQPHPAGALALTPPQTPCPPLLHLVLLFDNVSGRTIFCAGLLKPGVRPGSAQAGDICTACMKTGQGNYLANLVLYPGRAEFVSFLPENTQGVAVQPIADRGVLIAGIDAVRGLGRLDQAWLASVADKLEVSLEGVKPVKTGVGFGATGKRLPDWRSTLTPAHMEPTTPLTVAVLHKGGCLVSKARQPEHGRSAGGRCHRLQVWPGAEGIQQFCSLLCEITAFHTHVAIIPAAPPRQVTFQCKAPGTGQPLSLRGISAFNAAIHCAAVAAAERVARQVPGTPGNVALAPQMLGTDSALASDPSSPSSQIHTQQPTHQHETATPALSPCPPPLTNTTVCASSPSVSSSAHAHHSTTRLLHQSLSGDGQDFILQLGQSDPGRLAGAVQQQQQQQQQQGAVAGGQGPARSPMPPNSPGRSSLQPVRSPTAALCVLLCRDAGLSLSYIPHAMGYPFPGYSQWAPMWR
ncbi:hypothetical protein QJQ45_025944 [Haematococcus lacustris]|nr:hypothetical protein QJQ45_025944 [Haematococcus lacustris]